VSVVPRWVCAAGRRVSNEGRVLLLMIIDTVNQPPNRPNTIEILVCGGIISVGRSAMRAFLSATLRSAALGDIC
jgi:hypothetical protein